MSTKVLSFTVCNTMELKGAFKIIHYKSFILEMRKWSLRGYMVLFAKIRKAKKKKKKLRWAEYNAHHEVSGSVFFSGPCDPAIHYTTHRVCKPQVWTASLYLCVYLF